MHGPVFPRTYAPVLSDDASRLCSALAPWQATIQEGELYKDRCLAKSKYNPTCAIEDSPVNYFYAHSTITYNEAGQPKEEITFNGQGAELRDVEKTLYTMEKVLHAHRTLCNTSTCWPIHSCPLHLRSVFGRTQTCSPTPRAPQGGLDLLHGHVFRQGESVLEHVALPVPLRPSL